MFSIVIPAYNYAQSIARAIDSVLLQNFKAWEVIVVDDGSTDDTANTVAAYVARDRRIRYIHQENSGASAARNRGAAESTGEYLIFLDADDELLPGALEVFAKSFTDGKGVQAVFAAHESVSKDGERRSRPLAPLSSDRHDNFSRFLEKKFDVATGAVAIRRSVIERISFPVAIFNNEDVVFFSQILALYECVSISTPVLRVHHHPNSLRSNLRALRASPVEQIVAALFSPEILPSSLFRYRASFYSRLCLSRFRSYYLNGCREEASASYRMAIRLQPSNILRFNYLSKYFRMKIFQ